MYGLKRAHSYISGSMFAGFEAPHVMLGSWVSSLVDPCLINSETATVFSVSSSSHSTELSSFSWLEPFSNFINLPIPFPAHSHILGPAVQHLRCASCGKFTNVPLMLSAFQLAVQSDFPSTVELFATETMAGVLIKHEAKGMSLAGSLVQEAGQAVTVIGSDPVDSLPVVPMSMGSRLLQAFRRVIDNEDFVLDTPFVEFVTTSANVRHVSQTLLEQTSTRIPQTFTYDYSNLRELANANYCERTTRAQRESKEHSSNRKLPKDKIGGEKVKATRKAFKRCSPIHAAGAKKVAAPRREFKALHGHARI
jgi:hypothetical protein